MRKTEIRTCDGCKHVEPCTDAGTGQWFCIDCEMAIKGI